MDGMVLTVFLLASFLGGLTSGLAGFAMGLVVSGIYLHILTPIQTATLIVGYGFVTQGYGVWALRHAVRWRSAAPFIAGGLIGVPAGTMLLTYIDPAYMRIGDWRAADCLQHLQSGATGDKIDPRRRRRRGWRWISKWFARRIDRPGRDRCGRLVPIAQLAQRCPAHDFPAGAARDHPDEHNIVERRRRRYS